MVARATGAVKEVIAGEINKCKQQIIDTIDNIQLVAESAAMGIPRAFDYERQLENLKGMVVGIMRAALVESLQDDAFTHHMVDSLCGTDLSRQDERLLNARGAGKCSNTSTME